MNNIQIHLHVSPELKALCQEAAAKRFPEFSGRNLQEWARQALEQAAKAELEK